MSENKDLIEEILASEPCPTTARLLLARLAANGQYDCIVKYGPKALSHNPHDIELMKLMAEAYKEMGFLGLAEDMLEKACSSIEKFSVLFKDLADLYAKNRDNEKAIACLRKYLSYHPDDHEAKARLDTLQTPQEPEISEPPEPGFAQGSPTLQDLATPTLAEIYFNQGQIQEAIEIYESVLARHPEDHEAARRLEELKAMVESPAQGVRGLERVQGQDHLRARKERMIDVLESWLGKIQEMNRGI